MCSNEMGRGANSHNAEGGEDQSETKQGSQQTGVVVEDMPATEAKAMDKDADVVKEDTEEEKTEGLSPEIKATIIPIYLSVFLDTMGISILIPVLPYYAIAFGADAFGLGLIMTTFSAASVLGSSLAGYMSDQFGRKPLLVSSIAGTSVGFILHGFCNDFNLLIGARIFSGLFANSMPIAQACIADTFPIEERPKFLGLIGATVGIAFTLGPGIGALLTVILEEAGMAKLDAMRVVLFALAGLAACSCTLACVRMKETHPKYKETTNAAAADADATKEDEVTKDGKQESDIENPPAADAAASRDPVWALWVCLGCGFTISWTFTVMQTLYPLFLVNEYGWSSSALGAILFCCGWIIAGVQGGLVAPLVKKVGKHGAASVGAAVLGLGMLGYTCLTAKYFHLPFFALHIVGFSISQTAIPALVTRYADDSRQGAAAGQNAAAQALGRVLCPLVSGVLYEKFFWQLPYFVGVALAGLVVIGTQVLLCANRRSKPDQADGKDDEEYEMKKDDIAHPAGNIVQPSVGVATASNQASGEGVQKEEGTVVEMEGNGDSATIHTKGTEVEMKIVETAN